MNATARSLAKLAVLAAGLVAGGFLLRALGAAPGTDWVEAYVRDDGLRGEVTSFGTRLTDEKYSWASL